MISHKIKKDFGEKIGAYVGIIESIINSLPKSRITYSIMPVDSFKDIIDVGSINKIYWDELLGRAHFAAITSIIRSYRWLQGMIAAQDSGVVLPYCASYRGLIESVADSYYSLKDVAPNLAGHKNIINSILSGKIELPKEGQVLISKELENLLIHYSHAKVSKGADEGQPRQNAKPNSFYIDVLKKANVQNVSEIYSELCQYVHPSSDSISYLCEFIEQDKFSVYINREKQMIEYFTKKYKGTMIDLIMHGFTPSIIILKVLLHYNAPMYHSKIADGINCSSVPAWVNCEGLLRVDKIPVHQSGSVAQIHEQTP